MRCFRIEISFLAISKKEVRSVLDLSNRNRKITTKGFFKLFKTGSAVGPDHMNMFAYKLVTPLMTFKEINDLTDLLTSLYQVGCIIDGDHPLKIHFLGEYWDGFARRIVYEMVSNNQFMHTLLLYRKHYSQLSSYSLIANPLDYKDDVFIPYSIYFKTIKNQALSIMVEELIAEIILNDARPD